MLSDPQLERYSRQILLSEFDVAGQEKLLASTVLVLGLGGLGSPAAMYLASAGVGKLILVDGDTVELSNLQRQIVHRETSVGKNKALSAAETVMALNSEVVVEVIEKRLGEDDLRELVGRIDLIVDASDNYPIRYALNRACIAQGVPLVSAAAVRGEGQISVFEPARGGPCYRCLYPDDNSESALNCSESGVLAPVVGVFGSLLALETIKVLTGYGETLRGKLLLMDLATLDVRKLELPARIDCPDCGHRSND